MAGSGVKLARALPIDHPLFRVFFGRIDLRNHRKIVVIDGQIGYTGSQNLIKRNYFRKDAIYYDELVARVCGPVVGERRCADRVQCAVACDAERRDAPGFRSAVRV